MKLECDRIMSLSYVLTPSPSMPQKDIGEVHLSDCYYHEYTQSPSGSSNHCSEPPSPPMSNSQERRPMNDDFSARTGVVALLERRKRNKTASAKYRQKKNKQQTEMKRTIDQLIKRDSLLKQQVVALQVENQKIKSLNDDLRSEILAQKMLHHHFNRQFDTTTRSINA